MKHRLLDMLVCPVCQSGLTMHGIEETGVRPDDFPVKPPLCTNQCALSARYPDKTYHCHACMEIDVRTGILMCKADSAHMYPIINSIPRMLSSAMHDHASEFFKLDTATIPQPFRSAMQRALAESSHDNGRFQHILESFSSEWNEVSDGNNAWGRSLQERRQLFFKCMNLEHTDLTNSIVFDAGAGHGEALLSIADTGAEIIGMDLSYSVDIIQRFVQRLPERQRNRIHLVQGNVCEVPFRDQSFDLVHSAGVLHHNPDTFTAFKSVARTVKTLGLIYIEVYSGDHKNRFETWIWKATDIAKILTIHLPHSFLHLLCYVQVPFYKAYHYLFNLLTRSKRYRKRSFKEMELSIFDGLSPKYAWHHTTREVANWFQKLGFNNVRKTFFNHNGIGLVGEYDPHPAITVVDTIKQPQEMINDKKGIPENKWN
ncbi:methyltransferase domain-containing protein [candidate division KSB1 bacterium]|nr:methyltransferase domain-containing protein [candidate division KSB1 bacterium]